MIRVGIYGYGNLARGVELSIANCPDMQLVAIFTRRDPNKVITANQALVKKVETVLDYKDKIDVMIMCGGSATDLPVHSPQLVKHFHIVDSFDNHHHINEHFNNVDLVAKKASKVGIISIGWDPGLFSLNRLIASVLPSTTYTFWGKGVSQGHSDAIRRIEGVKYAVQYTIPLQEAIQRVRHGEQPSLKTSDKHLRDCYVVINDGYNPEIIRKQIITMPDYFADYHTTVHFIDEKEFLDNHQQMPHGGHVITSGKTANNHFLIEYSLELESNPQFTALILLAYTRACYQLALNKQFGAKTIYDIPLKYLSPKNDAELRKELL